MCDNFKPLTKEELTELEEQGKKVCNEFEQKMNNEELQALLVNLACDLGEMQTDIDLYRRCIDQFITDDTEEA